MKKVEIQLIDAYLDGRLAEQDVSRLNALLEESSEARSRLRLLATVEEGLSDMAAESEEAAPANVVVAPFRVKAILPWAIATAACLVLVFQQIRNWWPAGDGATENRNIVALVVDDAGAIFEEGQAPADGVRCESGDYRLSEGAVHLRFSNGTDLVMRAPAEFSIRDPFRVDLAEGSVRAIVPPTGHGFTIGSPGVDYEDIGTEFGVSVSKGTASSELHVFDGQVNLREPDSTDLIREARLGDSFAFSEGTVSSIAPPEEGEFPTPGAIGYLRWKQWQKKFADDPGLIGFFAMDESEERKKGLILNTAAEGLVSDGEIMGARWVSGRWPEKKALLFDRDNDAVELNIPGEFEELSMAVWMNVDRLDREVTAILDSNEWDLGDVHWQISRTGFPWVGINDVLTPRAQTNEVLYPGKWSHVACVISMPERSITVFVNGKKSTFSKIQGDGPITPGISRLGNWLRDPEWPHSPVRGLRGRIDELAVWNRALSEKEISDLVKNGQPTALWAADSFTTTNFFSQ